MKILRRFRWSNLLGKKFFSYGLYAVGEIILIIAGILLALQINNWNDEKNTEAEENRLLGLLQDEFEINLEALNSARENNLVLSQSAQNLKDLIGKKETEIRAVNINSLLYNSILIADFQPNQYMLSQLSSTDNLQIIQSTKLKKLLYEWDKAMNAKEEAYTMLNTYFMNSLIPFLDEHASIRNMDYYGNYDWSSLSPLHSNTIQIFNMIQFDNRLENHQWCISSFSNSINGWIYITDKVIAEIRIELDKADA